MPAVTAVNSVDLVINVVYIVVAALILMFYSVAWLFLCEFGWCLCDSDARL